MKRLLGSSRLSAAATRLEKDDSPRARIAHLIGMFIHGIGKR